MPDSAAESQKHHLSKIRPHGLASWARATPHPCPPPHRASGRTPVSRRAMGGGCANPIDPHRNAEGSRTTARSTRHHVVGAKRQILSTRQHAKRACDVATFEMRPKPASLSVAQRLRGLRDRGSARRSFGGATLCSQRRLWPQAYPPLQSAFPSNSSGPGRPSRKRIGSGRSATVPKQFQSTD
jgi:hypothetical protein